MYGHCRQGLVAACLLMSKGLNADTARTNIQVVRSATIPETSAQRNWIHHYKVVLAGARSRS
jgi:hypothetical protein